MKKYIFSVFIKLLREYSNFINSDDCIGKMISKAISLNPVFIQKRFDLDKKEIISSEKIRNLSNSE